MTTMTRALRCLTILAMFAGGTPLAMALEDDDGRTYIPQMVDPETRTAVALDKVRAAELEALAWMARLAYCVNRQPDQYLSQLSQPGYGLEKHLKNCSTWRTQSKAALADWTLALDHVDYIAAHPEHRQLIEDSNLVFTVHARQVPGSERVNLVVAIRGTTLTGADWRSNLRWFTRVLPGDDHYDAISTIRGPLLNLARLAAAEKLRLQQPTFRVAATGHSLGGGLAQLLAYGEPHSSAVVFNTTPVTGYHSLVKASQVNCQVPIDRVEESGEVLQYLRTFIRNFYKWEPNMQRTPYNFNTTRNIFTAHGMHHLARGFTAMVEAPPTGVGLLPDIDASQARQRAATLDHAFRRAAPVPQTDCACLHERKGHTLEELSGKWPLCGAYVKRHTIATPVHLN